ncbi:MAG: hypothetical protein V4655_13845 [Bdellovibrionota bacterium]|nr:MAG: hypothetical protein EOP09_20770 [Pseudomonadota bacterium]
MKTHFKVFLPTVWIALSLSACGPDSSAPNIPEPLNAAGIGADDLESSVADANMSPTDSLSQTRLAALPAHVLLKVETCEKEGRFYSLGESSCTRSKPADFPCRIDDEFKKRIDAETIETLDDYIVKKARNLQLYACTENDDTITLHFYRYGNDVITYRTLQIPKS